MEQRGLRVISEYFEALAAKPTKDTLYRGHADCTWELVPSVFRSGAKGIDCYDKLNWWTREAARFVSPVPQQPIEWLVLAQHFGIPTPMLDWTSSPLVGLYFACESEPDKPGCVWQVRTTSAFIPFYHLHTIDVFKRDRGKPALIYATAMNARTLAQDSAMSLHGPNDLVEPALMRRVYTVQPEVKADTVRALGILGFTKERLFSDLNVLVARFKEELGGRPTALEERAASLLRLTDGTPDTSHSSAD